jgi:hypothetical protein
MVAIPEEINIRRISLTLPLALAAFAILVPSITAWAINYYKVNENACNIVELKDNYKELRSLQRGDTILVQLQGQKLTTIEANVGDIKSEQRSIDEKIDELLRRKQDAPDR